MRNADDEDDGDNEDDEDEADKDFSLGLAAGGATGMQRPCGK